MKRFKKFIKESNEPIDLSKKREEKNLQKFHSKMRSDISDRVSSMREAINKHREAGRLPMNVGDRFTTEHSRRNNQPPFKVTGHYVDMKNPENRYGYHIEQGEGENKTTSMHMVADPRLEKLHGPEKWKQIQAGVQKLGGLKKVE